MLHNSLEDACIRVLLVLGLVIGAGTFSGCGEEKEHTRIKCMNHLKQIGISIHLYADKHEEHGEKPLPDKLNVLVEDTNLDEEMLQCPGAGEGKDVDYKYAGSGLSFSQVDTKTVLVFDKKGNHEGFINVLFGDGHVEGFNVKSIDKLLKENEELYMPDSHAEWLNLKNTEITDKALKQLGYLDKLRMLNLTNTDITDDGLKYLQNMYLNTLRLGGTHINDDGLKYLRKLNNLKNLTLKNTDVTDEGVRKLKESLPDVEVKR